MQTSARPPVLLTAAPHPFRAERSLVEMPEGLSLLELLEVVQPDPILRRHAVIFIRGEVIPREWWPRVRPRAGTHVEVKVLPTGGGGGGGGKNPLRTVLTIAMIAASVWMGAGPFAANFQAAFGNIGLALGASPAFAIGVGQAVVGLGGMLLFNAVVPNRPPKMNQLSGTSGSFSKQDSPTLFIEGARNQARPFSPVPVVLGKHRVVPPYGAAPYTETVGDKQFLRLLFVWGAGPLDIDVSSLRIGDTPLTQFTNVETEHRQGLAGDTPLTLYPDQVAQTDLSVSLTAVAGWQTRSAAANADELSVDFTFPRGLVQFSDTGARGLRNVSVELEYRLVGAGAWSKVDTSSSRFKTTTPTAWLDLSGTDLVGVTFSHNKTAAVRHGLRWPVPARGSYEIRVRRTTADSDSTQVVDELLWSAIRSITDEDPISSPVPLAKTALVIQASDQLNRIVDEFSGIVTTIGKDWDPTSPAQWLDSQQIQNPASLFRHVLQGNGIAEALPDARIDLTTLQDWHEFCEAKGFKFNMVRDFQASVWDTLADIAAAGRASPTQIDGKWSVVIDQAQAVPVSHVTPRNSSDFRYERMFIDLPHAWRTRFPNEDQDYRQDERRVYRDGYTSANATKFETLELPGVTDSDQVFRLGRYRIAQGVLQPELWQFRQDMEYLTYRRGDRIAVTHDVLLVGLHSGRVKSVTVDGSNNVTALTLDEPVVMSAGTDYGIALRTPTNAHVTRQVVTAAGTTQDVTLLTVIAPVSGQPAVEAGDIFGFGLLGSETDDALVLSVKPEKDFGARVTCVPYRALVYSADTETIPTFTTNITPVASIPALSVTSVESDEGTLAVGPGESLRTRIAVSFTPLSGETFNGGTVRAQYRPTQTGEPFYDALVEEQTAERVVLGGVQDGETWDLRLRFEVPGRLLPGPWTYVNNHTVVGKSTPPSGLAGLTISAFGGQALMRWDDPAELDVQFGGEVQFRHSAAFSGASWAESASIGEAAMVRTRFAALPLKPGTYLARVFDSSGNPSATVATVTTKQASVLLFAAVSSLDEAPAFSGTHSGTLVDAGILKLAAAGLFDDIPDLDAVADLDSYGGIITTGTYTFAAGFDLTTVKRVRLTTRVSLISVNVLDLIDDRVSNIDDWEDFDGTNQAQGDCKVYVRHTDDNPAGSPTWTAWERLDSAEFQARGFQFKAVLSSTDAAINVHVSELGVDVEEVP